MIEIPQHPWFVPASFIRVHVDAADGHPLFQGFIERRCDPPQHKFERGGDGMNLWVRDWTGTTVFPDAGTCVVEVRSPALSVAAALKEITTELGIPLHLQIVVRLRPTALPQPARPGIALRACGSSK